MKREEEKFEFDVALSFAGSDRQIAESLAELLVAEGLSVFYDLYVQARLWGKDLYQHLQRVYRDRARYCVVFVSKSYLERPWSMHELKQVQARDFIEHRDYILPVRLDDTELPGLNPTIGYVDLRQTSVEGIASLLLGKILGPDYNEFYDDPPSWDGELVEYRGMKVASFWPAKIASAQSFPYYLIERTLRRIPYGGESYDWGADERPCHDCGAIKGEYHVPSCDVEECPQCGEQALGCRCIVGYSAEDS